MHDHAPNHHEHEHHHHERGSPHNHSHEHHDHHDQLTHPECGHHDHSHCTSECGCRHHQASEHANELFGATPHHEHSATCHCDDCETATHKADKLFDHHTHDHAHGEAGYICSAACQHEHTAASQQAAELFQPEPAEIATTESSATTSEATIDNLTVGSSFRDSHTEAYTPPVAAKPLPKTVATATKSPETTPVKAQSKPDAPEKPTFPTPPAIQSQTAKPDVPQVRPLSYAPEAPTPVPAAEAEVPPTPKKQTAAAPPPTVNEIVPDVTPVPKAAPTSTPETAIAHTTDMPETVAPPDILPIEASLPQSAPELPPTPIESPQPESPPDVALVVTTEATPFSDAPLTPESITPPDMLEAILPDAPIATPETIPFVEDFAPAEASLLEDTINTFTPPPDTEAAPALSSEPAPSIDEVVVMPAENTSDLAELPIYSDTPPEIEPFITPEALPTKNGELPPDSDTSSLEYDFLPEAEDSTDIENRRYVIQPHASPEQLPIARNSVEAVTPHSPEVERLLRHLHTLSRTGGNYPATQQLVQLLAAKLGVSEEQARQLLRLTPDYQISAASSVAIARLLTGETSMGAVQQPRKASWLTRLRRYIRHRLDRIWIRINRTLPLADMAKL